MSTRKAGINKNDIEPSKLSDNVNMKFARLLIYFYEK